MAEEPVSTGYFNNVAAGGHDVKAYHQLAKNDKALKGSKNFVVKWKGADWRFLNEEDSKAFVADPERYAPVYNGYCANALSLGEGLVGTNGKHWVIFESSLYLFYAARGAQRWLDGDYRQYKKIADKEWNSILSRKEK